MEFYLNQEGSQINALKEQEKITWASSLEKVLAHEKVSLNCSNILWVSLSESNKIKEKDEKRKNKPRK